MTLPIQSDSHAVHFLQGLEKQNFDAAFKQLEAFLLQDLHDTEELKTTCDVIGDFLPHLSSEKAEDVLELFLTVLVKYPLLPKERATILTHWGDLFGEREAVYPNLCQMMNGYATAYFLEPTNELSQKLLTPFLPYVYEGCRAWIGKAAREGNPERFGELLATYQQKFGCSPAIQRRLYEIADEIYEQLSRENKAKFTRFVTEIQQGKQGELPVQEEKHLIFHYQNQLKEIREGFSQEEETRPFQQARTHAFLEFFHALLEDAILMLGIPPCKYDVRTMGSLAREEMCPYSDLEYLILIEEETHRPFFRRLAQIFSLQILSFGETEHSIDIFDCGRYGLQIDKQSNPSDDESLIIPYEEFFIPPRELDPNASQDGIEQYYQMLKAKKSRLQSVSLHHNYVFPLSLPDLQKTASLFLKMRREEFRKLSILEGTMCHIKYELMEPLFHFIGDLGLYYGIEEQNTLALVDKIPIFSKTSKRLLKEGIADLYNLRIRLHLAHGGIQESVSLVPHLILPTLSSKEKRALEKIRHLILFPLYEMKLVRSDLIEISLRNPSTQNVKAAARSLRKSPLNTQKRYYQMLASPDHAKLQVLFLEGLPRKAVRRLMWIPNRSGYRQARKFGEKSLAKSLTSLTTEDPSSGIKIRSPLVGDRYLTVEAARALIGGSGHIIRKYKDSLHHVCDVGNLHFKELPYQPLMEYAVHSLTHRIMGKATPATTLARLENSAKGVVYPVQISRTIQGERLEVDQELDTKHLTWLRLCELLTKPGDGRPSNYIVSKGKVFSIDNDISFMEPVHREKGKRKVSFCSTLFTLDHPLDPEVLQQFCTLEPDLILTDWLEELKEQEKAYLSLFSDEELKMFYNLDPKRRFSPTLLLPVGTVATLCMQFYHLQDVLRQGVFTDSCLLLRELISLDESTQNRVGILVERNYRKALQKPFAKRLEEATNLRTDQSMTSQKAMELNYKTIPTFEEIQARRTYSLEEAFKELCLLEAHKLWNQVFIIRNAEKYSLEADFSSLQDTEREKVMLKALQFLYDAKKQKPTSITLRHTQTLSPGLLKTLLHPNLRSLDLSYGTTISERRSLIGSALSQIEALSPNLEELHLEGCPSLLNPTITLPQLKRLNISHCPNLESLNITKAQLQELKINHSPRLITIQVPITHEIEVDWKETPNLIIPHIAEQFYQFGKRYAEGWEVLRDPEKALALWEIAATAKHKHAEEILKWEKLFDKTLSLDLKNFPIGDQGAATLADALKVNQTLSSLSLGRSEIGAQGAAAIADALKINQTLSSLYLGYNQIGNQGVAALADALKVNHALSSLDLGGGNLIGDQIGNRGATALADALKVNHALSSLDLGQNKIGSQGATALADALKVNHTLSSLHLRNDGIGNQGAAAFADALKVNNTLSSLYLGGNLIGNQIGNQGAAALADALKVNHTLSSLDLGQNKIGIQGATAFAEALKINHSLSSLHLRYNQIGDQGAAALADAMKVNHALSSLHLGSNQIGGHGAAVLANAMKVNHTLSSLYLGYNQIGNQGVTALAEAMKINHTLSSIYLRDNEIEDKGAAALAAAMKVNHTLSSLDLGNNEIRDKGAAALAEAMKVNHTLSILNLWRNLIEDQGAAALADALKVNYTLSSLSLKDNEIGDQGAAAIADALKDNHTLSSLHLRYNQIGDQNNEACQEMISQNASQQNSAFQAAQDGDPRLLNLLDTGVSLYSKDNSENTFLHLAANLGHTDLIQPLLKRSLNPTFHRWKNKEGKTALDLALENGYADIAELLMAFAIGINTY